MNLIESMLKDNKKVTKESNNPETKNLKESRGSFIDWYFSLSDKEKKQVDYTANKTFSCDTEGYWMDYVDGEVLDEIQDYVIEHGLLSESKKTVKESIKWHKGDFNSKEFEIYLPVMSLGHKVTLRVGVMSNEMPGEDKEDSYEFYFVLDDDENRIDYELSDRGIARELRMPLGYEAFRHISEEDIDDLAQEVYDYFIEIPQEDLEETLLALMDEYDQKKFKKSLGLTESKKRVKESFASDIYKEIRKAYPDVKIKRFSKIDEDGYHRTVFKFSNYPGEGATGFGNDPRTDKRDNWRSFLRYLDTKYSKIDPDFSMAYPDQLTIFQKAEELDESYTPDLLNDLVNEFMWDYSPETHEEIWNTIVQRYEDEALANDVLAELEDNYPDYLDESLKHRNLKESIDSDPVDFTRIVERYPDVDIITSEELSESGERRYYVLVTNVDEAKKFNYHDDYWGSAEEYQKDNIRLVGKVENYIEKLVKVHFDNDEDPFIGLFRGVLIDRQYNDLEHTKFLIDPVELEKEPLGEDTVKKSNGKWVNRGDDGTEHGEFKTKKQADAQRKAMFANGYKGESKKRLRLVKESFNPSSLSREDLIDALDSFSETYVDRKRHWPMSGLSTLEDFEDTLSRNGWDLRNDGEEGIYTSMSDKELVNAYNEIRDLLLYVYNHYYESEGIPKDTMFEDMPEDIMDTFHLKRAYIKESKKIVKESRGEYSLSDLGYDTDEEESLHQEVNSALETLVDSLGCDSNYISQYSRWGRVVEDISYMIAAYKKSLMASSRDEIIDAIAEADRDGHFDIESIAGKYGVESDSMTYEVPDFDAEGCFKEIRGLYKSYIKSNGYEDISTRVIEKFGL